MFGPFIALIPSYVVHDTCHSVFKSCFHHLNTLVELSMLIIYS